MHDTARGVPLLLTLVVVTAFVLLFLYAGTDGDPTRGDPLVILRIPEMHPDELCTDDFTVDRAYDRMGLSYRFEVAVMPRITLTAPDGTEHTARVVDDNLSLDIADPAQGTWRLTVALEETAGVETIIQEGEVFMLGFPETEKGGTRPSICRPTLSDG